MTAIQIQGAAQKPSASFAKIDSYIEGQMRRLHLPGGALAIVEGDRIVHFRGFGKARPGGKAPSPQTPFFIGSLTKSFTALAVMQLVEAGKVELDAPVQRYLPWFRVADPQASAQITVRSLLNQTSALPMLPGMINLANFEEGVCAAEQQMRALSTLQLARPVGSKFEYSNLNYNLLGLVIEAASREPYSGYIQRHIFGPLGMCHSYHSKAEARRNGLAVGHRMWFGHPLPAPNLRIPLGSLPSGQLISCAEDMARYLSAYLNGGSLQEKQVLSESGIAEMLLGRAEINEMGLALGYYGMGWISQDCEGVRIVSHSGIVPDFSAFMALVPEQKKGLLLLFNANHMALKMTLDEVGLIAAQLLAGVPPSRPQFAAVPYTMRALLIIPVLQAAGVASMLRLFQGWRADPSLRPTRKGLWGRHILLPLLPSLPAALALFPMLTRLRGFLKLFVPDFAWTALIFGSFAWIWSLLRTVLVLRMSRKSPDLPVRSREGRL